MRRSDGCHRALERYLAPTLVAVRQELQRLAVERGGLRLGPSAPRLIGCGEQVVHRSLGVAGLAPVVGHDRGRVGSPTRRLLQEFGHLRVMLATSRSWKSRICNVPDQRVLERVLVVALQTRAP